MTDHRITHAARMLDYETWATEAVVRSLLTVPIEQSASPMFIRALRIMGHIQIARRVWLARIEGRTDRPEDWFPPWTVDQIREISAEIDGTWRRYARRLTTDELDRTVAYTSSEGALYSSRVEDVLTHVFNHSTYHRGQVARLVTDGGGSRASTDYIVHTRATP